MYKPFYNLGMSVCAHSKNSINMLKSEHRQLLPRKQEMPHNDLQNQYHKQ